MKIKNRLTTGAMLIVVLLWVNTAWVAENSATPRRNLSELLDLAAQEALQIDPQASFYAITARPAVGYEPEGALNIDVILVRPSGDLVCVQLDDLATQPVQVERSCGSTNIASSRGRVYREAIRIGLVRATVSPHDAIMGTIADWRAWADKPEYQPEGAGVSVTLHPLSADEQKVFQLPAVWLVRWGVPQRTGGFASVAYFIHPQTGAILDRVETVRDGVK